MGSRSAFKPRKAVASAIMALLLAGAPALGEDSGRQRSPLPAAPASGFCVPRFGMLPYSPRAIWNSLGEVPGLREVVLAVMEDPRVDLHIKEILKHGLEGESRARVVWLTAELRKTMEEADGHAIAQYWYKRIDVRDASSPGWSRRHLAPMVTAAKPDAGPALVGIDKDARELNVNPLQSLLHELAHVRAAALIERDIEHLARILPRGLVGKTADGKYWIDNQLELFLQERYALFTEYRAMHSMEGRHLKEDGWLEGWKERRPEAGLVEADRMISRNVIMAYPAITNRLVRELALKPLWELLPGI